MSAISTSDLDHEERLTRALVAGDADAFDELYRLYARRLAAYATRIVGDPAGGEDVAQVALLNAYEALRRGSRPRHLRAWLYRIARNAALEARSRDGATFELEDGHGGVTDDDGSALRQTLVTALGDLPERQRAAFLLREVQGLRVSEISEMLGLSGQQVEQALFAARNRLAEHLTFGRRLDCEAVRELRGTSLDRSGRRALTSHLRACSGCRRSRAARVGALGLSLLRDAAGWLVGGGAPAAAAKMSAVAVATAVAATPVVERVERAHAAPPQRAAASTPATGAPAAARPNAIAGLTRTWAVVSPNRELSPLESGAPSGADPRRVPRLTGPPRPRATSFASRRFRAMPLVPDGHDTQPADPPAAAWPSAPEAPTPEHEDGPAAEPAHEEPPQAPAPADPKQPREPDPTPVGGDERDEPTPYEDVEGKGDPEPEAEPAPEPDDGVREPAPEEPVNAPAENDEATLPPPDGADESPIAMVEPNLLDAPAGDAAEAPSNEGTAAGGDQGLRPKPALSR